MGRGGSVVNKGGGGRGASSTGTRFRLSTHEARPRGEKYVLFYWFVKGFKKNRRVKGALICGGVNRLRAPAWRGRGGLVREPTHHPRELHAAGFRKGEAPAAHGVGGGGASLKKLDLTHELERRHGFK